MRIAVLSLVWCWCLPLLCFPLLCFPAMGDDAAKQDREERLAGMRLRAEATKIAEITAEGRPARAVLGEPLYRYQDEPRDILDGTLWAYGGPGRPAALQKIEIYRNETRQFYCLTSLSGGLLDATWRDGEKWSSKQAGIAFAILPEGPSPAKSKTARLFQMKQIASRFTAELFNEGTQQDAKMRVGSRPIHVYADPAQGVEYGAIFGYATYGTNPDVLLSIELHKGESEPIWKYGLARMTLYKVTVDLDGTQVWQVPFAPWQGPDRPSKFETWLFFHEAAAAE